MKLRRIQFTIQQHINLQEKILRRHMKRKYFGNECNVMAEVLLSRYDLFMSSNMLTHVTTNMSATEIEETYGPRVRSRMREMFNVIAFESKVADKRV